MLCSENQRSHVMIIGQSGIQCSWALWCWGSRDHLKALSEDVKASVSLFLWNFHKCYPRKCIKCSIIKFSMYMYIRHVKMSCRWGPEMWLKVQSPSSEGEGKEGPSGSSLMTSHTISIWSLVQADQVSTNTTTKAEKQQQNQTLEVELRTVWRSIILGQVWRLFPSCSCQGRGKPQSCQLKIQINTRTEWRKIIRVSYSPTVIESHN